MAIYFQSLFYSILRSVFAKKLVFKCVLKPTFTTQEEKNPRANEFLSMISIAKHVFLPMLKSLGNHLSLCQTHRLRQTC